MTTSGTRNRPRRAAIRSPFSRGPVLAAAFATICAATRNSLRAQGVPDAGRASTASQAVLCSNGTFVARCSSPSQTCCVNHLGGYEHADMDFTEVGGPAPVAPAGTASLPTIALASTAPATPTRGAVPEAPSRNDVIVAMNNVRAAMSGCWRGSQQISIQVTFVFDSSGRVTRYAIGPSVAGATSEACMIAALGRVIVPRFSRPIFVVTFPFVLRGAPLPP